MTNAERDALTAAVKHVVADQRQSYTIEEEPNDRQLVEYVRNSLWVHVDGVEDYLPQWEVSPHESDPETYEAYKAVLTATKEQLDYVFLSMV